MKDNNTSNFKENKREEIKFESFKKPKNNKKKVSINHKNNNAFLFIVIIIVLVLLFILSSILNVEKINKERKQKYISSYKTINKFNGHYANINPLKRKKICKEIGFDIIKDEVSNLNGKNYIITYAYNKKYANVNSADILSVFYDENYDVLYVSLDLIYNKDDFKEERIVADCNAVLNNFIHYNLSKKDIKGIKKEKYKLINKNDLRISYSINKALDNKNYYDLNVLIER